jgi:hypothetical protein
MRQCHSLQAFAQTHTVCQDAASTGIGFKTGIPHKLYTFDLMVLIKLFKHLLIYKHLIFIFNLAASLQQKLIHLLNVIE